MRVLITGKNGQLARAFAKKLKKPEFEVGAPDEESLDITKAGAVRAAIDEYSPDVVLNCAAYNFVDDAERDFETAFRINATGVKNLATACAESKSLLVHYSSDYVFDGTKDAPYTEEDEPDPVNGYGKSKLAGEQLLKESADQFLLCRTSWLFGEGKQNFLYKMLQLSGDNTVLSVVNDQTSIPTSTAEIVRLTLLAINKGLRGIYHLTPSGYASRYEVVKYLLSKLGMKNVVMPVSSDYFPSPARRPRFSVLSNAKLATDLGVTIPHWTEGIDWYAEKLNHYEV